MKKRIVLLLMMMVLVFNTCVFAGTPSKYGDIANLKNSNESNVKTLIEKYNLEVISDPLDNSRNNTMWMMENQSAKEMMSFDSITELETFILELQNEEKVDVIEHKVLAPLKATKSAQATQDRHYKKWKAYANGSLFAWEHVFTNYTYEYKDGEPKFVSINTVDSDITGINVAFTYTHKDHNTPEFSNNNKTVKITARGRAVFGVTIEGFTLGVPYTKYIVDKFTLVKP
jgi:hypothetical protein